MLSVLSRLSVMALLVLRMAGLLVLAVGLVLMLLRPRLLMLLLRALLLLLLGRTTLREMLVVSGATVGTGALIMPATLSGRTLGRALGLLLTLRPLLLKSALLGRAALNAEVRRLRGALASGTALSPVLPLRLLVRGTGRGRLRLRRRARSLRLRRWGRRAGSGGGRRGAVRDRSARALLLWARLLGALRLRRGCGAVVGALGRALSGAALGGG